MFFLPHIFLFSLIVFLIEDWFFSPIIRWCSLISFTCFFSSSYFLISCNYFSYWKLIFFLQLSNDVPWLDLSFTYFFFFLIFFSYFLELLFLLKIDFFSSIMRWCSLIKSFTCFYTEQILRCDRNHVRKNRFLSNTEFYSKRIKKYIWKVMKGNTRIQ